MALRNGIQDFELANAIYKGATVTFYTVFGGIKTTTKATLYADTTTNKILPNPQHLGADGKFIQPVYVEVETIATVSGLTISDHDTGVLQSVLGAGSIDLPAIINAAPSQITPVSTDAFLIRNGVSGFLNKVLLSNALNFFAAKFGNALQTFSVAQGTDPDHAVRLDQLTVPSGASLIGFMPPGSGATATTSGDELRKLEGSIGRTLESYGAVGDGATLDSAAWDLAVASGLPILLGNKKYRIGDKVIQRDNVVILGQQMPTPNPNRTALAGGSILLGSLLIDGNNVRCENFGVDRGNDYTNAFTGGLGGNGFVAHNSAQLGVLNKNNHFKNIVGLIRIGNSTDPQAAFHGVLLESLIDGTAHNVVGVNGWFGVVLKVTDFNCGDLYGVENDTVSVQVKSNSYGAASRVNINNVITKNYSARGYVGFLVVASDAELTTVSVSNIATMKGLTSVRVLSEVTQPVVNVSIGHITSRDAGANGIDVQGACYGIAIGTASIYNPVGIGFSTTANTGGVHPVDVTIGTLRVVPSVTSSSAIDIGSIGTKLVVNTVNAAGTDGSTLAAGSVLNLQSSATIGQYFGILKMAGAVPALVNGWVSSYAQPTGLMVKSGMTRGYGRLSAAAATSDIFMTIPSGMRPDNLAFYTTMTGYQGGTGTNTPINVLISATGDASIVPNRAYYAATVTWYNLTDLCFPTEIPATGAV